MLLIAVLALVVAGSASAAHPKSKLVRVVKHDGAFTATLTYVRHGGTFNLTPISHATLRIERNGHVVLQRKICQPYHSVLPRYRCEWGELFGLSARRVGPTDAPAFVVDFYTGGNTCCGVTFVVLLGQHVVWIKHGWTWESAGFKRLRGRGAFVARDGRFYCAFSVCAGGSTPIQLWEINAAHKFVDVTRHFPWLIRKDATSLASGGGPHQTIRDQGSGVIAAVVCGRVPAWARGALLPCPDVRREAPPPAHARCPRHARPHPRLEAGPQALGLQTLVRRLAHRRYLCAGEAGGD